MVWMLDDGRQFRFMWDDEDGEFEIDVRRGGIHDDVTNPRILCLSVSTDPIPLNVGRLYARHALCVQHSLSKLSELKDFNRTATIDVDCDECSRGIDKEQDS